MRITVIGCGRWGSFIAWYLNKCGHSVSLYGREGSANMLRFIETRGNGLIELPDTVKLTTSLEDIGLQDIIVISINSQSLSALMDELSRFELRGKTFVLCMKGIEISTGRRLSEIAASALDKSNNVAVWLGPGHVQEFYRGVPNCMVVDSEDESTKTSLVDAFSSELIRFYYGNDIIGSEIGAASKNVVGITAGMLDGLGLSTLKGALMSRGTREISRLIAAMGGNGLSAYGLCHLGDYEATLFSQHSHNRQFGEMYVRGEKYGKLAEGYYTAAAMMKLSAKYGVELPICAAAYDIMYSGYKPEDKLNSLLKRSLKNEFEIY